MRLLTACLLISVIAFSTPEVRAESADACYLGYPDCGVDGDMLIGRIQIPYATLRTYYCLLHWNAGMEGGGYCGLQRGGYGSVGEIYKHFHYSLWNSASTPDSIRTIYKDELTHVDRFGGEGTGKKCLWPHEWQDGAWYTLVTRIWPSEGESRFGFWVRDESEGRWHHVVTLGYPVSNVWFYGCTGGFLEDFGGTAGLQRRMHSRGGWKRSLTQTWVPYDSVRFGAAGSHGAHNGGGESDYCFVEAGGDIESEIAIGTWIHVPDHPEIPVLGSPILEQVTAHYLADKDSIQVSWTLVQESSPQFAYTVFAIQGDGAATPARQEYSEVNPSTRFTIITAEGIDVSTASVGVLIEDIFGQLSPEKLSDVTTPTRRTSWGDLKHSFGGR